MNWVKDGQYHNEIYRELFLEKLLSKDVSIPSDNIESQKEKVDEIFYNNLTNLESNDELSVLFEGYVFFFRNLSTIYKG
jgi:archaellum component FlaF (FlaF/FlaG flagellin family)